MTTVHAYGEQQAFGSDSDLGTGARPSYDEYVESPQGGKKAPSTVSTTLEQASSILARLPGAKTISYCNAGLLGGCGLLAFATAWWGGFCLLMVLMARWYLPMYEAHHVLPLNFDYAAGPAQATVWLPLLRPSPFTAALSPPSKPIPATAAGLSFRGAVPTSGGFGSSSGSSGSFSGLGFSPLTRHSGSSSSSGSSERKGGAAAGAAGAASEGWWSKVAGSSRRRRRAAAAAAAAAAASVMVDAGGGLMVPEGDWLLPLRGETRLKVELELPGWPTTDLVQVSSELFSQQGISLGRWTQTWLQKPKPLMYRLMLNLVLGPWKALGLLDDTIRLQLPMFESFQNPQPPPGGWASVPAYRNLVLQQQRQQLHQWDSFSSSKGFEGSAEAEEEEEGLVERLAGPRALWLKITLTGRSSEAGPPKVYRASAKLDMRLSLFDRFASSLRPGWMTAVLVIGVGLALMLGGAGSAAVLLLLAYLLYRWGSSIKSSREVDDEQGYDMKPFNLEEFMEAEEFGPHDATSQAYYNEARGESPVSLQESGGEEVYEEATFEDSSIYEEVLPAKEVELSPVGNVDGYLQQQLQRQPGGPGGGSSSISGSSAGRGGGSANSNSSNKIAGELVSSPTGPTVGPHPVGSSSGRGVVSRDTTTSAAAGSHTASVLWRLLGLGHSKKQAPPQEQQQQPWEFVSASGGPAEPSSSSNSHGSYGSSMTAAAATTTAGLRAVGGGGAGQSRGWGREEAIEEEQDSGEEVFQETEDEEQQGQQGHGQQQQQQQGQQQQVTQEKQQQEKQLHDEMLKQQLGQGQQNGVQPEEIKQEKGLSSASMVAHPAQGAQAAFPKDDWRRQLLEESDDEREAQQQQQQQKVQDESNVQQQVEQQQQQKQREIEQMDDDQIDKVHQPAGVMRRLGFTFRS